MVNIDELKRLAAERKTGGRMTTYAIKTIPWKREPYPGKWTRYTFETPFCGLYWVIDKSADGRGFECGYNFHDAFDCDDQACSSLEDGMKLASENWEMRLKQCLEPVNMP